MASLPALVFYSDNECTVPEVCGWDGCRCDGCLWDGFDWDGFGWDGFDWNGLIGMV